jgi:hypothetical protein
VRLAGHPAISFAGFKRGAGSGVVRPIRSMGGFRAGGDFGGDFRPRAKAGIDESAGLEAIQCCRVRLEALGLVTDLTVPADPKPAQILDDPGGVLRPGSTRIDIFDPKPEPSLATSRKFVSAQGRISVAEVKPAGGARCEARNNLHQRLSS